MSVVYFVGGAVGKFQGNACSDWQKNDPDKTGHIRTLYDHFCQERFGGVFGADMDVHRRGFNVTSRERLIW